MSARTPRQAYDALRASWLANRIGSPSLEWGSLSDEERAEWEELLGGDGPKPEPGTVPLDAALLHREVRRLYAALERLASDDWLGTQGYDSDELRRRVEFARDKLDAAPQEVPGHGD